MTGRPIPDALRAEALASLRRYVTNLAAYRVTGGIGANVVMGTS